MDGAAQRVYPDQVHYAGVGVYRNGGDGRPRLLLAYTRHLLKRTLNWTLPRMRHPKQANSRTWLAVRASLPNWLSLRSVEMARLRAVRERS